MEQESKGSSALRLATSLLRAKSRSTTQEPAKDEKTRIGSFASTEPSRRGSLVGMPLRLMRSRTRSTGDVEEDVSQPVLNGRLADMFFAVPNEIQVHILCFLEVSDLLSLRLASRALAELLQLNASILSRVILRKSSLGDDPILLQTLYRPSGPLENMDYFLHMLHRETIVLKMVSTIADYIQIKFYRIKSTVGRKDFAPGRARMERRLKVPTFVIYRFLEDFRAGLHDRTQEAWGDGKAIASQSFSLDDDLHTRVINRIPKDRLLPAFQFFRVMVSAFRQKLRPPSYAGTLERKLRGWGRAAATDADVAQVLLFGGMEEVLKVMANPTYGARLEALGAAIERINEQSVFVGSKMVEEKPKHVQDSEVTPNSYLSLVAQGSVTKLTTLYLPWIRAIVASQREEGINGAAEPDSHIPSPFVYIEDLLKDHEASSDSSEAPITARDFVARANAPVEDEEDPEFTSAGPAHAANSRPTQYHFSSFSTQYG